MRKLAILLIFTVLCSWNLLSEEEPAAGIVKFKRMKLSECFDFLSELKSVLGIKRTSNRSSIFWQTPD
jgi:hypothetical protein